MVQLGTLTEMARNTNVHLITLNGKVAAQEARVGKIELDNAFKSGEKRGAKSIVIGIWSVVSALLATGGITLVQHLWH